MAADGDDHKVLPGNVAMLSFLGFLEQQMRKHPDRIQPLDPELLDEIGDLVRGVRAA